MSQALNEDFVDVDVGTIRIPKVHLAAFLANKDEATEVVTKSLVAHLAREDFLARMTQLDNAPHIPEAVFAMLDQKSLTMARLVSRAWRTFVDENSPLWEFNTDQTKDSFITQDRNEHFEGGTHEAIFSRGHISLTLT